MCNGWLPTPDHVSPRVNPSLFNPRCLILPRTRSSDSEAETIPSIDSSTHPADVGVVSGGSWCFRGESCRILRWLVCVSTTASGLCAEHEVEPVLLPVVVACAYGGTTEVIVVVFRLVCVCGDELVQVCFSCRLRPASLVPSLFHGTCHPIQARSFVFAFSPLQRRAGCRRHHPVTRVLCGVVCLECHPGDGLVLGACRWDCLGVLLVVAICCEVRTAALVVRVVIENGYCCCGACAGLMKAQAGGESIGYQLSCVRSCVVHAEVD